MTAEPDDPIEVDGRRLRLAVYAEGVYRQVPEGEQQRFEAIPGFHGFILYVLAVGEHFDRVQLIGRLEHAPAPTGDPLLPADTQLAELPYYAGLTDLRGLSLAFLRLLPALWRALGRADVVWVFGPHPVALAVVLVGLARRRRVVLAVRNDPETYWRSRAAGAGARREVTLALTRALNASFRLLSIRLPTTVVGERMAESFARGAAPVLPMTVTLLRDGDLAPEPRTGDLPERVTLVTVGRVDAEKNPLLVVDLLAELERRQPGRFRLVWAGSGALLEDVRRRAHEVGVGSLLELRGFVPYGTELLDVFREGDVFVHVSLTEGVPATVLEALGLGLPVVATDVGGVREALAGGRGGLLVPPADLDALVAAVETMAADRGLRERLAAAGHGLARGRTIELEAARVAAFVAGRYERPRFLSSSSS